MSQLRSSQGDSPNLSLSTDGSQINNEPSMLADRQLRQRLMCSLGSRLPRLGDGELESREASEEWRQDDDLPRAELFSRSHRLLAIYYSPNGLPMIRDSHFGEGPSEALLASWAKAQLITKATVLAVQQLVTSGHNHYHGAYTLSSDEDIVGPLSTSGKSLADSATDVSVRTFPRGRADSTTSSFRLSLQEQTEMELDAKANAKATTTSGISASLRKLWSGSRIIDSLKSTKSDPKIKTRRQSSLFGLSPDEISVEKIANENIEIVRFYF